MATTVKGVGKRGGVGKGKARAVKDEGGAPLAAVEGPKVKRAARPRSKVRAQALPSEADAAARAVAVGDAGLARLAMVETGGLIAALVILGAFFGEGFALTHVIPAGSEVLAGRVLGTLDSALLAVLYYYFGGSAGSDRKTELLASGQPVKEGS